MTNADKFKSIFGLYATELWAKPEKDFLEWLNADVELFGISEQLNDLISRRAAVDEKNVVHMELFGRDFPVVSVATLKALPSVQPETAKRIVGKSRDGMTLWYQCNMCNEPVDAKDNYCRGCGRRLTDG